MIEGSANNSSTIKGQVSTNDLIKGSISTEQKVAANLNVSMLKDYSKLENKPSINGVELNGNLTTEDLGILDEVQGFIDSSVLYLEKTLQDILTIIQGGELDELTISQIEELIVSYFENKTVEEVEA